MVKNKMELLALAAEWTNRAKNDMRGQLLNFIHNSRSSEEEVADALGLSMGEISQILRGNGELTLSAFAKILIATDNVVEIRPISSLPTAMRKEETEEEELPRHELPLRDSHGRFMSRKNASERNGFGYPTPQEMDERMTSIRHDIDDIRERARHDAEEDRLRDAAEDRHADEPMGEMREIDLDTLSRSQLVNLIHHDGLDELIDVNTATRSEMIDLLETNQRQMMRGAMDTPRHFERVEEPINERQDAEADDTVEEGSDEALVRALLSELEENPRLRSVVNRFMHK